MCKLGLCICAYKSTFAIKNGTINFPAILILLARKAKRRQKGWKMRFHLFTETICSLNLDTKCLANYFCKSTTRNLQSEIANSKKGSAMLSDDAYKFGHFFYKTTKCLPKVFANIALVLLI